jgi:hypothetical protein
MGKRFLPDGSDQRLAFIPPREMNQNNSLRLIAEDSRRIPIRKTKKGAITPPFSLFRKFSFEKKVLKF